VAGAGEREAFQDLCTETHAGTARLVPFNPLPHSYPGRRSRDHSGSASHEGGGCGRLCGHPHGPSDPDDRLGGASLRRDPSPLLQELVQV
jgi:hypothetical protein